MTGPLRILFLQGPHGPLFARLGKALAERGHAVHRINLNGGDRFDWSDGAANYRGTLAAWPAYLERYLGDHAIDEVILFGDCRPHHAVACELARKHGVRLHVFEEGYIRPNFMTFEEGGVNGNSMLPRNPDLYRREAARLPALPEPVSVPSSFARRVADTMRYALGTVLLRPLYPFYRSHRTASLSMEALGWALHLTFGRLVRARSARIWDENRTRPYFALPLQLNTDYQLRVHSPFRDMRAALREVVESFARAAPADAVLLVKRHPLDSGIRGWDGRVRRLAKRCGVADRVHYLSEADIAAVVGNARGVVTVNSTAGTLALNAGVPTAVLGEAIYGLKGITHQGMLDTFWQEPTPPDMALYDAFRRVLVDRCLILGGYLSDDGIDLLIDGAIRRIEGYEASAPTLAAANC